MANSNQRHVDWEDAGSRALTLVGTVRDVTEAEEALRESEARLCPGGLRADSDRGSGAGIYHAEASLCASVRPGPAREIRRRLFVDWLPE